MENGLFIIDGESGYKLPKQKIKFFDKFKKTAWARRSIILRGKELVIEAKIDLKHHDFEVWADSKPIKQFLDELIEQIEHSRINIDDIKANS